MAKQKKTTKETHAFQGNLQELIIQSLIEKKGEQIVCIDLKPMHHVLFDYFIICTGTSKPHVETLGDFVQESTKKLAAQRPSYVEGRANGEWVLLDYFNIIVHIFQPEIRQFYNIESLWSDAPQQWF
ncbi:MAG: ribosome silencing factor [Bacteroidales bacterium]|jgi:ribosome-associated protein|nr:ribosome silencing factor [Bacteroidales bacterium]